MIRLSICIATYKRAEYLGETLRSIAPQLRDDVELLVFDGASPDDTAAVVGAFAAFDGRIRYHRAGTNGGVDADFDAAVGLARGAHVWLFADDDLIAPGAVERVLAEIAASDPDVLVVDAQVRDRDLARVLEPSRLPFAGRRDYGPGDADALLRDAGNALSFIGCAIVRRAWWLGRDRARYYGSLFVHVGAIFQAPPPARAVVLAEPLARIRLGNAMWNARGFEIWNVLWPELIWALEGYSDAAKTAVTPRQPWRDARKMLLARASGGYGRGEYKRFLRGRAGLAARAMLLLPGRVAHLAAVAALGAKGAASSAGLYNLLVTSRHANAASRALARAFGATAR